MRLPSRIVLLQDGMTRLASSLLHVRQSILPQGGTATFCLTHATLLLHCSYHPHLLEVVELMTLLCFHMAGQQTRGGCHITPQLQSPFRTHNLPHLFTRDMLLRVWLIFAMDIRRATRFVVLSAPGQTEAPSSRHISQERQRPHSAPDRHNIIQLEYTQHVLSCVVGASPGTCSCWLQELPYIVGRFCGRKVCDFVQNQRFHSINFVISFKSSIIPFREHFAN